MAQVCHGSGTGFVPPLASPWCAGGTPDRRGPDGGPGSLLASREGGVARNGADRYSQTGRPLGDRTRSAPPDGGVRLGGRPTPVGAAPRSGTTGFQSLARSHGGSRPDQPTETAGKVQVPAMQKPARRNRGRQQPGAVDYRHTADQAWAPGSFRHSGTLWALLSPRGTETPEHGTVR